MAKSSCELSFRVAGGADPAVVEISIDGADYRRCRREGGVWLLRWEGPLNGDEPIVAVIRAVPSVSGDAAA